MRRLASRILALTLLASAALAACLASVDEQRCLMPTCRRSSLGLSSPLSLRRLTPPPIFLLVPYRLERMLCCSAPIPMPPGCWSRPGTIESAGCPPSSRARTSARFRPPLVISPLSSQCTKYLGAIMNQEDSWVSTVGGRAVVQGTLYRPQIDGAFDEASLILQFNGPGKAVAADYAHVRLTASTALILFEFSVQDLGQGSVIKFDLRNPNAEPLAFEAAFFGDDCPAGTWTGDHNFVDRLPIGIARVPPTPASAPTRERCRQAGPGCGCHRQARPGSTSVPTAERSARLVPTSTSIVVQSGVSDPLAPYLTPAPTPTPVMPVFSAEHPDIAPGDCTIIRWDAAAAARRVPGWRRCSRLRHATRSAHQQPIPISSPSASLTARDATGHSPWRSGKLRERPPASRTWQAPHRPFLRESLFGCSRRRHLPPRSSPIHCVSVSIGWRFYAFASRKCWPSRHRRLYPLRGWRSSPTVKHCRRCTRKLTGWPAVVPPQACALPG